MALYVFGIFIVLSLVHNSIQDNKCYECMEYDNKYDGQASNKPQSFNHTIGARKFERLCHDLDEIARPDIIRSCSGDCAKAVVKVDDNVDAIYRACASDIDCNTFTPPIPGAKTTFCEKCSGDGCNSTTNITASLFLIFLSGIALLRNF